MRSKILLVIFIIFFIALTSRLFYWQIIKRGELSKNASNQYLSSEITSGNRGSILAADSSILAIKSTDWRVFLETKKTKLNPYELSSKISKVLDGDQAELENLIKTDKNWILLKSKVDDDTKKNLEALKLSGVGFEKNESRFYPEASVAAQILGFVGKDENGDNLGYFGLEGFYNLALTGKSGFRGAKKDAKGIQILTENSRAVESENGVSLVTGIDKRVQMIIEEKLEEGIEKYSAIGGSVTVMDPIDGKIIAMASLPSYDPANYQNYNDSLFKNPVITDTFEPGSIFKIIVMASGIDSSKVSPDTKCEICDGPLKIDKYEIKTWNNKYTKDIKMTDVIVHSDNVGMAYIGQQMGDELLYDYLDKFGIGKKSGIDLQGEVSVKMRNKGSWNIVDLATTTFGQGIATTGIQMLRAVSVIANGGYLITPHVVTSIEGDDWKESVKLDKPQRIISEKSAKETALMMVEAVNQGEAKWAKPAGFNNIAGKTGTAQIPVAGHYDPTNTNHSFIGFAPYDKPKFIMLVTLRSPQSSPWAAETAAPMWFFIAKELFLYLGVSPN